ASTTLIIFSILEMRCLPAGSCVAPRTKTEFSYARTDEEGRLYSRLSIASGKRNECHRSRPVGRATPDADRSIAGLVRGHRRRRLAARTRRYAAFRGVR